MFVGFEITQRAARIEYAPAAFMGEHVYPREHDWNAWALDQDNLWEKGDA